LAIVTTQPFKSKNKYSVFSWGSNSHGQLGLKTQKVHVPSPEAVVFDKKTSSGVTNFTSIVKAQPDIGRISAGTHHSLFLDSTQGIVYGAGSNSHGQLGKTMVSGMDGEPVKLNIDEL
jgi:alpha-tubulin suppressor-like RCC1 family protein